MGDSSAFIEKVFSPFVAIAVSEDADELCAKNGLTFSELIQPFTDNIEVSLKDPSGNVLPPVKLKLNFCDLTTPYPQGSLAKKQLSEAVLRNQPNIDGPGPRKTLITHGIYEVDVCPVTPWYNAYRDAFFRCLAPQEHDFTRHFVGCVYVVSSAHQAPQQQLTQLIQNVSTVQLNLSHHSKWFFGQTGPQYFVLLHDGGTGDNTMAEATFLSMKNIHGSANCHMLTINSVSPSNPPPAGGADIWSPLIDLTAPTTPNGEQHNGCSTLLPPKVESNGGLEMVEREHPLDPLGPLSASSPTMDEPTSPIAPKRRGAWLTTTDRENVKTFVSDFATQCLAPQIEQHLKNLADQVANKKGLHRQIAVAAKSFFAGRGKGNILASNNPNVVNSVIYSQQAPELVVRKLGDLAFLFHQYETAYQAYHAAKRDFHGDQAWLYCAGAEEMAALSVFMLGKDGPRSYPHHYFKNAINAYLNVCKMPQLATRATLLHAECLRSLGEYEKLAEQLIHLISEDSDLRSALLLEQAAYCYLSMQPMQLRKYAFHLVLAGYRFSKAGMRKHSLRAYRESEQVFRRRGWSFAEDHILYMTGRQCATLGKLDNAFQAFHGLLDKTSQQSATQQSVFVKDYFATIKALDLREYEMPIPKIDMTSVRTILGHKPQAMENSHGRERYANCEDWQKLEECCYLRATNQKSVPPNYRNTVDVMDNSTPNTRPAIVAQNEPVTVELELTNPLQIGLSLQQVHLCWEMEPGDESSGERVSNHPSLKLQKDMHQPHNYVETCALEFVSLEAKQTIVIKLSLIPKCMGRLKIIGVSYLISLLVISPSPSTNSLSSDSVMISPLTPLTPLAENQGSPVWGYQTLTVKGYKLHAKKVKNNEWYAKDYRLQPTVGPPMPYLKADFDTFPKQMLCGEVQRLNLRLTNRAAFGLVRLLMAARNPREVTFGVIGLKALPPNNSTYKEMPANSGDLACNSASLCEVVKTHYVMSIPGVDSIEAGTTVSVPFWIRGPDVPGEHQLALLFYYEAVGSCQGGAKIQHRVTKFSAKISTISSLIVHASAEPSIKADDIGSILLSVHAKNSSELQGSDSVDLSLLQVSLMSEMHSIAKQMDVPPRTPSHSVSVTTIRPREVKDIALKLSNNKLEIVDNQSGESHMDGRLKGSDNEEDTKDSGLFSERTKQQKPMKKMISQWPLSIVRVESSGTPCADFMMARASKLGEYTRFARDLHINSPYASRLWRGPNEKNFRSTHWRSATASWRARGSGRAWRSIAAHPSQPSA
ncbi:trafficking protein particle complex subunit 8-like isoform X3 [Varroa destructor]|uniref:Trafficking protein particle complex subunit 8 n=1 Tax=Varroa destructor TaxID=109461 RepID=A0A7M7JRW7_VARDE|nr:trafficking protein particle complex subunit 8-like isoform X3 [Varroa destructor]